MAEARRRRAGPGDRTALALVHEGPHGPVIHAVNAAAQAAGVHGGARVTDMRAICPELRVEDADPAGDCRALKRLALWSRRWCPWVAVDGADGILLDTTGSDHLLGGEAPMLADIEAHFAKLGLGADLAVAPTTGAAWALARFGSEARAVCDMREMSARLAPLPVQALRLDCETVLLLQRLGLKTVGALADIPRLSLARRFARGAPAGNPLIRLDQAFGRLAEPMACVEEPPRFHALRRLAEPVQDPEPYLPGLADELCAALTRKGAGARRLRLVVYRVDGDVGLVEAATSRPSRDAAHLLRLFHGRLETLDPGFGFDALALEATIAEPLELAQTRLGNGSDEDVQLSRLIDRLAARLGSGAVSRPVTRESHIPERAEHWAGALETAGGMPAPRLTERPIRLLERPEEVRVLYAVPEGPPVQFIWRRQTHRVARYAGPERIAPEWWRDSPNTRLRDYFRIEDAAGRRYWLFREGVHGDGRGGDPRWFLHGFFA